MTSNESLNLIGYLKATIKKYIITEISVPVKFCLNVFFFHLYG